MDQNDNVRSGVFFILKLFAVGVILFISAIAGVELYRFSTAYELNLWVCLIPAGLILLLIPALFVRKKFRYLLILFVLTLVVCIPTGITVRNDYLESITVDTEPQLNIEECLPFQSLEDTYYYNIWRLGFWDDYFPFDLTLSEDLPVLDGSKYAFPIYSGVVNALYPETTRLGDNCFRFSDSAEAFTALLNNEVDIYFGFEPTQAEYAAAAAQGIELKLTPIAYARWWIVAHADNPVWVLQESQFRGILSGEITNWSEVGGSDEPIAVYQNAPDSEAHRVLERYMGDVPMIEPITELRFDWESGFHEEIVPFRLESNSIGFILQAGDSYSTIENAKSLYVWDKPDTDAHNSSVFDTVIYAITRTDNSNENIQPVLDWIISPMGQYMVIGAGSRQYYYNDFNDLHQGEEIINTAPSIQVQDYMPFRDETKIVKLDHEASLKLTDFLPRIDGAAAVFPVYSAFVDAVYPEGTQLHKNYDSMEFLPDYYFFNYSNTVQGYQFLAEKETDIFFGGYPSDEQIAYAEENDTNFVYTPIGYDAFVFFVHKDNPIDSLTTEQIQGIYSGQITNWNQVGGHDEEIVAYQRNEGSGSQSRLIRFMGDTPLMEPPTDTRIGDMMGITISVAQFRSSTASIGFSFRYYMETLVANPNLKLLAVDGIAPTKENIASGTYPLTGYLYAVSWEGNENENVQRLLDWILSPEGQYIIEQTGYVPVGPTE